MITLKKIIYLLTCSFFPYLMGAQTVQQESIEIEITQVDDIGIWKIHSCYDDKYRKKERRKMTAINSIYTYSDEAYYGEDGCFEIISRKKPELDDIKSLLQEITTIDTDQINFKTN